MRRLLNAQQWIENRNMRREERKKRGGEKAKRKSQDCCDTFKPTRKYCFLCLLAELRTLIQWFVGALLMWTDLFTATFTKHSPHVRESKTVLDSGFHVTYSGFQVLNSSLLSAKSLSFIPDSRFHEQNFPGSGIWIPLRGGENPFFLTPWQTLCFYILVSGSSSYGHLFRFPRVPAYESICCGSISSLI